MRVLLQGEAHWMEWKTQTVCCLPCVKSLNNDHCITTMTITSEHEAVNQHGTGYHFQLTLSANVYYSTSVGLPNDYVFLQHTIASGQTQVTAALHANMIQCWPTKAGRHRLMLILICEGKREESSSVPVLAGEPFSPVHCLPSPWS